MKDGIVVSALVVALLLAMVTVGSAASQLWYLDSADHPAAGNVMEKTIGAQSGNVTISAGEEHIWLAENSALCNVSFTGGLWIIELKTDLDWTDNCGVNVGGWDTTTGWYEISTTTSATVVWKEHILKVELQKAPATIYEGDYLALKIRNEDGSMHDVYTDGHSSLRSPDTDPGYPVPELPTLVLTTAGLLALAGYQRIRRKN